MKETYSFKEFIDTYFNNYSDILEKVHEEIAIEIKKKNPSLDNIRISQRLSCELVSFTLTSNNLILFFRYKESKNLENPYLTFEIVFTLTNIEALNVDLLFYDLLKYIKTIKMAHYFRKFLIFKKPIVTSFTVTPELENLVFKNQLNFTDDFQELPFSESVVMEIYDVLGNQGDVIEETSLQTYQHIKDSFKDYNINYIKASKMIVFNKDENNTYFLLGRKCIQKYGNNFRVLIDLTKDYSLDEKSKIHDYLFNRLDEEVEPFLKLYNFLETVYI